MFHGSGNAVGSVLPRVFGTFEVPAAFVVRAVGLGFAFAFAIGPLAGVARIGASARRRPNVRPSVPEAMIVNAKQLLPCFLFVNKAVSFQQLEHRLRSQRGLLQSAANAPESILRAAVRIPRARAAQLGGNAFRGNIAGQVPTSPVLPRVGEGVQEQAVQQRMYVVMHGRFASCGKASQHMVGIKVERLRISTRQRRKRIGGGNERQQTSRRCKEGARNQQPVFRKPQNLNGQLLPFAKLRVHSTSFACVRERGAANRERMCVHDGSSRSHASPARTHLRLPPVHAESISSASLVESRRFAFRFAQRILRVDVA